MNREPKNIFFHFLNKDTQEIYGFPNDYTDSYTQMCLKKGINASVLLCDADVYCFLPLGFWFESRCTRSLLTQMSEFIREGYIRFCIRESEIQEFIEKKREQYYPFQKAEPSKSLYQDFFDSEVLQQLLVLHPILIDRRTKIGQACTAKWILDHEQVNSTDTGGLKNAYSLITDHSYRGKIVKAVVGAADDSDNPFVWKKVKDLITGFSIRDKRIEVELRIAFEKNYYDVYLKEYDAVNLYDFYLIDRKIDFYFGMPQDSIANYQWFETFLKHLHLEEVLKSPDWKIIEIKQVNAWVILLQKYMEICNMPGRFEFNCGTVLENSDKTDIGMAINKIKGILAMEEEKIFLPVNSAVDVLIMVATEEEEEAIIKYEKWEKKKTSKGYTYFTRVEGLKFALARAVDMGMESGATAAQYYMSELNPRFLAMAGFGAGKKGIVNLGDIVVPSKIYQYGSGKQLSETELLPELNMFRLEYLWQQKVERFGNEWREVIKVPKPMTYEHQLFIYLKKMIELGFSVDIKSLNEEIPDVDKIINTDIKKKLIELRGGNIVATEDGKNKYNNDYYLKYPRGYQAPELKVRVGALATGTTVQQWSGIFKKLEKTYERKTSVLDMEGFAIMDVAKFNRVPCLISKGVGDFANKEKKFDNRYITYAVYSAYRFLVAFFNGLSGQELLGR